MKKILTGILALLSVFACATGCNFLPGNDSASSDVSENIGSSDAESSEVEDDDLATAADYLKSLYLEQNAEVRNDYEVLPAILGYSIAWSVDVEEGVKIVVGEDGKVMVDVDENLDADLTYVLTATLSNEAGVTTTVSFTRKVLAALALTPEAITAAPVEGVAYKYHVYQSTLATDMYFAGGMAATYYFKTTTNYEEAVDIYVDYVEGSTTEFYVYFEHTTDGKQYFGVKVSDDGAHDNIVYTSSPISTFVWNAELGTITTHLDATKNNGGPNDFYFGNYGTKDTISASYISYAGGDGNNVGHLVEMVNRNSITPEVKVAFEKEALAVDTDYTGDKTVELATLGIRYTDVTVAWSIAENANATISGNTLTIVAPTAETTVVLTATITCGEVVETKEFTLTLKPANDMPAFDTEITIPQANAIGASFEKDSYTEGKYYVVGVIKEVYNTTYGNMYIKDADGNELTVYGTYSADGSTRYDAMESKPVAGDTVKVYGIIGSYNAPQMKNAWIVEWTAGSGSTTPDDSTSGDTSEDVGGSEVVIPEGAATATISIADYASANGWANGTRYAEIVMSEGFTVSATGTPVGEYDLNTGKYYTSGTNWRIYQTENATVTITAADGLTIVAVKISYAVKNTGCLTLNGANIASDEVVAVDASSISFGVGNTGTATNGQAQITAIQVIYTGAASGGETPDSGETPDPEVHEHVFVEGKCECGEEDPSYVPEEPTVVTTIADALAAAEGTAATFSGTVSEIYQVWNSQYSNMSFYVTDGTDRILVFRAGTMVGVGDEVTVDGKVTLYNSTNQIAQGATVTITTVHTCSSFVDADCYNAAVCTVCGAVSGTALGHIDENADNTCDRCNANLADAAATITASKTIAELITSEGWTNATTKQSFKLDDVVSVKVNGGSNSGKAYNGDHIRIYATDSPAGTLTISVPEGYELVSVKISTKTGTYAFLYVDGSSDDISNVKTAVSGTSVLLKSVKNGSDGKQIQVTAIEVEYKAV